MPGNVSWARRKITEAFGTKLVFSDPMEGSDGAIRLCRKMVDENPGALLLSRPVLEPVEPARPTTTPPGARSGSRPSGRVTHFVTGIGTSGTVMGTGRRLKEYRRDIEVCAVEPDDALHGLEGLKHMASSIVPADLPPRGARRRAADGDRRGLGRLRAAGQGGGHAGRPLVGRVAGGRRPHRQARWSAAGKPGVIVTLFPDRAERYFEAPRRRPSREARQSDAMSDSERPRHPIVTAEALAEIYAHARRDYPNECCGIVFGPQGRAGRRSRRRLRQHPERAARRGSGDAHARRAHRLQPGRGRPVQARRRACAATSPRRSSITRTSTSARYFSDTDQAAAQMDGEPTYPVEYVVIDVRRTACAAPRSSPGAAEQKRYVEVLRYD